MCVKTMENNTNNKYNPTPHRTPAQTDTTSAKLHTRCERNKHPRKRRNI